MPNLYGPYSIRRRCIAGKYVHEYLFDYIRDLYQQYSHYPKLVFAQLLEGTQEIPRNSIVWLGLDLGI
jgi:hypothetical protein